MSAGCAYSQRLTAEQAAARLRDLADQLSAGKIAHLSVALRFDGGSSRVDYYGAGYKPLGGGGA